MAKKNYINFLEFQDTALDAGEYTITLNHTLSIDEEDKGIQPQPLVQKLFVQGDRFKLDPSEVYSLYPASGSRGNFQSVLPHIMLNRSTLPWERRLDGISRNSSPNFPWLALLVFHDEAEVEPAPQPITITLKDLMDSRQDPALFVPGNPGLAPIGELETDPVTVIDVKKTLLQQILPKRQDLLRSAHVRRNVVLEVADDTEANEAAAFKQKKAGFKDNPDGEIGLDRAVIVANRLPKPGCRNVVHLVSLEDAFVANGEFDFAAITEDKIRLVSLKNWSFFAEAAGPEFATILKGLDATNLKLKAPAGAATATATQYIDAGFTVLPHALRIGRNTLSLYRGPLLPADQTSPEVKYDLPVETADKLLLFDGQSGLLDVSYAAAWTLGRQLALEDRQFSLLLYKHKTQASINQRRNQEQQDLIDQDLPLSNNPLLASDREASERETAIQDWLHKHRLLDTIPFQYLLPSVPKRSDAAAEGLTNYLPPESLRFFRIDPFWFACMQDGALSIGESPGAADASSGRIVTPDPIGHYTGFLLRSSVINHFPGFRILGFPDDKNDTDPHLGEGVPPSEMRRLSEDILLCLFEHGSSGERIQTVDFFLEATSLHFGLKLDRGSFKKELKDVNGDTIKEGNTEITADAEKWQEGGRSGLVLDFAALATSLQNTLDANRSKLSAEGRNEFLGTESASNEEEPASPEAFTAADFALQMLEGTPRVRFSIKND